MFNKKGEERELSFYWIIIFTIVAVALVSGVLVFYSHPIDVRKAESGILANKVVNCVVHEGVIQEEVIEDIRNNGIDEACDLVLTDKTGLYDKEQYYIELNINGEIFKYGDEEYGPFCGHEKSKENIPVCYEREFFVLNSDNSFVKMEVLGAVAKIKQNS